MLLNEGTKLEFAHWKDPRLHLDAGEEKIQSLTVSLESGGPWIVVEYDSGVKTMYPLQGNVAVRIAKEQDE